MTKKPIMLMPMFLIDGNIVRFKEVSIDVSNYPYSPYYKMLHVVGTDSKGNAWDFCTTKFSSVSLRRSGRNLIELEAEYK